MSAIIMRIVVSGPPSQSVLFCHVKTDTHCAGTWRVQSWFLRGVQRWGWPCVGCLTKQNKQPGRDVGRQRARPTNLRLPAGISKGGHSALTRCTTGFARERKALHTVSRARFCYCLRTRSSTYSRTARPFLRRMPGGWVVWLSIYNSIQFNLHKGWIEK